MFFDLDGVSLFSCSIYTWWGSFCEGKARNKDGQGFSVVGREKFSVKIMSLKQLKFKPKIDFDDKSGIYSGEVMINHSIFIYGFRLKKLSFEADSGVSFTMELEATLGDLKKLVNRKKLGQFSFPY